MLYIVQPGFGILLNKPVLNEFEKHIFGENIQKDFASSLDFFKVFYMIPKLRELQPNYCCKEI